MNSPRAGGTERKKHMTTKLARMTYVVDIIFITGNDIGPNEFGQNFTPKVTETAMPKGGGCCDERGGAGGGCKKG